MAAPLLIPILGDQLTPDIASLRDADPENSILLMMEVADETSYVRHHKAKISFILSAMRHHAERLKKLGWTVDYVRLPYRHWQRINGDERAALHEQAARFLDRLD